MTTGKKIKHILASIKPVDMENIISLLVGAMC